MGLLTHTRVCICRFMESFTTFTKKEAGFFFQKPKKYVTFAKSENVLSLFSDLVWYEK